MPEWPSDGAEVWSNGKSKSEIMMTDSNVAVIFDPHADDADWWTGGLSLLLIERGWKIHYVCVGPSPNGMRSRAKASAKILGVSRHFLDIAINGNGKLEHDLRKTIPPLISDLNARLIFIPSLTDYHQEHVTLSQVLLQLFHWSAGTGLRSAEVYAYDSHENRDPVEIYIDVSTVWDKHIESLQCHALKISLTRSKTGRAMVLGASIPSDPVLYAEGYRLLQGDVKNISSLCSVLPEMFFYRNPHGLLSM